MSDTPPNLPSPPPCRDCKVGLELGFLIDRTHGGLLVARWCSGVPQSSWMSGEVKLGQAKLGIKTVTYRCPKCFRLESFAPPSPDHE